MARGAAPPPCFVVGDVVRLKSGGPRMTIQHLLTSQARAVPAGDGAGAPLDYAHCSWFTVAQTFQSADCALDGLEKE